MAGNRHSRTILCALASASLLSCATARAAAAPPAAAPIRFDIPAQPLGNALRAFATAAHMQILFDERQVDGLRAPSVRGAYTGRAALGMLLSNSGLVAKPGPNDSILVERPEARADTGQTTTTPPPPPASSADIIVTAQKREQKIQDVPIAISAFSGKTLDAMKIETGGDLLKSIPNVTFSKNNFAGYNFSIRGIGTKAVAASTDPAVAVAFNSSNLIVNRLFEQEFYDIERVEVLRGPQGTLYGRNATAGVVNIISNKANLGKAEGFLRLETGSFKTRRASGAVNMPIVEDRLALRVAGAYTKRDGFAVNELYNQRIDGRDLFSTRVTVSARPIDPVRLDLIWEHFNENDDRQRTGKQLCHKDPGPSEVGGIDVTPASGDDIQSGLSQGCRDGSLYDDEAFSTPNGKSLNAYRALRLLNGNSLLYVPNTNIPLDPYAGATQSRNLRRFSAVINPTYKARDDVLEANLSVDLGKASLVAQTVYDGDRYYSTQDYSRYVSNPIFKDFVPDQSTSPGIVGTPGGIFVDPQLGPSSRLLAGDLIRTRSHQFSQEVRLQSNDSASPLQYVIGGNYTNFHLDADYNVYINTLTLATQGNFFGIPQAIGCPGVNGNTLVPIGVFEPGCVYSDPNPIGKGPQDGHNYFRSINPYRLTAWGAFADVNYAITSQIKLIAGIRLNIDRKRFEQVPSQLLLGTGRADQGFVDVYGPLGYAGFVNRGYPTVGKIKQSWTKPTGRAGLQWTPDLSFTNKTMAYATYSRGYKAGGANPPGPGFGTPEGGYGAGTSARGQNLATTFRPEYINSYEVGIKNTLLGGKLTFDATGFFYDYKDYQVSQIIDRSSQNENFDATVWGLEFETVYNPFRNVALNANLGYERSRIKKGQRSIDVLNRTQGREGYYVVKPFVQLPSNCVVSEAVITRLFIAAKDSPVTPLDTVCQGSGFSDPRLIDPANYAPGTTVEDLYPNGGRGFFADLGGNELPNTPHLTFNVGAQYTLPIAKDWGLIGRVDYYRQSGSYARVYNDIGDRLHAWQNLNLSLRLGNERLGLLGEFYVKNVLDATPITDAFINSDDTGLTTNVFTLDPRIFGVNITKSF